MSETPFSSVSAAPKLVSGYLALLAGLSISALAGVWPTWHVCGSPGLISAIWAACVNLAVFVPSLACIWFVRRRFGQVAAGKAFVLTGVVRIGLMIVIAFGLASQAGAEASAFWLWAGGLYVVLVIVEAAWLARGLSFRRPALTESSSHDSTCQ